VVALGGGHGLSASLTALRTVTRQLTAVVIVADDGGSSGRLRREMGIVPPGDLRMALAALAADDSWSATWADIIQHRFGGDGPLHGHAMGNLLVAAAAQRLGGLVPALDLIASLLHAHGRVLPMSLVPLDLVADVAGLDPHDPQVTVTVRGQVAVATTRGQVVTVRLEPADPPACPEAVAAIRSADWVVLGPGSWFTSVIPHLLVPDLGEALIVTPARRALVLNLSAQDGETSGFSAARHLEVLATQAPSLRLDVVLADPRVAYGHHGDRDPRPVEQAASALGAQVLWQDVAAADGSPRHDPHRLAEAFRLAFATIATPPTPPTSPTLSTLSTFSTEGRTTGPAVEGSGPWP
jgi:uncharacterized cofD-like protein